jgi:hypothetical protein
MSIVPAKVGIKVLQAVNHSRDPGFHRVGDFPWNHLVLVVDHGEELTMSIRHSIRFGQEVSKTSISLTFQPVRDIQSSVNFVCVQSWRS